ncbi:hypothetical protein [Actinoplanes solisilvae]|uniref:hypothetical protein n=1 Tax=Actinoplanes solisilvae TaxID=2486853 RepID=UPI000FD73835|nr:hypothetical protein [Actinoplanes solisilvae]
MGRLSRRPAAGNITEPSAASRAIGLQPGSPVTIKLTSTVRSDGLPPFTSATQLQMNSVQFAVTAGNSLDPPSNATPGTAVHPRNITVFGHNFISTAAARSYAIIVFLLASAGAVAVFLLVRRKTPLRTRESIEQRHPRLLVHVEPMSTPPGKPVVNVDNFPALVRQAERYGQMILTWRRPDADDFVVRDEGITYRHRIPLTETVLENVDRINHPKSPESHRRKESEPVS